MAILNVVIAQTYDTGRGRKDLVPGALPFDSEVITTGEASQQASIGNKAVYGAYWILTASGGDMWVKFGSNPTAAAGDQWLILDGQTREFAVDSAAQKLAVINA